MNVEDFRRRLTRLAALVWFQRAVRLLLRAAWLGGGGYLVALAIHSASGRLATEGQRLALAVIFALPALVGIFWPRVRHSRLAWRIDRLYGFQEQLSTAWEVSGGDQSNELVQRLFTEAEGMLLEARRHIIRRGWAVGPDLLSAIIIGVLLSLALGTPFEVASLAMPPAEVAALPPLGSDPEGEQIFPSGIPGLDATPTPTPTPAAGPEAGESGAASGEGDAQSESAQEGSEGGESGRAPTGSGESGNSKLIMGRAMKGLGQLLSEQGVSHEAGRALQRADFSDAAREFEVLADLMDQVSAQTQAEMAEAFEEAAQELAQENDPLAQEMAQDLEEAAKALEEEDTQAAERSLDQLAGDLRALDQQLAQADGGGSGGEDGPPATDRGASGSQDLGRLYGEAGTFSLSELDEASGLLGSNVDAETDREADGEVSDSTLTGDSEVVDTVLAPSPFSWEWWDVVSQYFSR